MNYLIRNAVDPATADLTIYAAIGREYNGGIGAKDIIDELAALPSSVSRIRVHVNNLGGNPFDGVAIANALRDQRMSKRRTVETLIEGLAASAATVITSAGSPITIWDSALMMIHDPAALILGTAAELRSLASGLDSITESIVMAYRWVSTKTEDELRAMMKAGTWFDADEAITAGLATQKVGTRQVAAKVRVDARLWAALGTVPGTYATRVAARVEGLDAAVRGPHIRFEEVYATRNQSHADGMPAEAAPNRPRSFNQLAASHYAGAGQGAGCDELIGTCSRGGVR